MNGRFSANTIEAVIAMLSAKQSKAKQSKAKQSKASWVNPAVVGQNEE